jgi:hypothetical protein
VSEIALHAGRSSWVLNISFFGNPDPAVQTNSLYIVYGASVRVFSNAILTATSLVVKRRKFLISGDIETAKTMLNHCLEKHDRFSEGHLLMAQV